VDSTGRPLRTKAEVEAEVIALAVTLELVKGIEINKIVLAPEFRAGAPR
jgi:hypothetical protein